MQFLTFLWISKLAKLVKKTHKTNGHKRKVIQNKQNALDDKSYKVKCNLISNNLNVHLKKFFIQCI